MHARHLYLIQQEQSCRVITTPHLLRDVADDHPLLPESENRLTLGGGELARPSAHTSLSQQAQEGGFGDAAFFSKSRTHLAGLVASDELIEFVGCEAIGQAVAMSGVSCLLRARPGSASIDPLQFCCDGRELFHFAVTLLRVTCQDLDQFRITLNNISGEYRGL